MGSESLIACGRVLALWPLLASCSGCLPGDTRPEPGSVYVTTAASAAAVGGLSTEDGWTITFERFLAALGAIELMGESCNGYAEPRYTRLFDFAQPMDGPEKVALVYGLGDCHLGYELSPPEDDAILGSGATGADLEAMRVEEDDAWIDEPERTSVHARGSASRGGVTKRFEWVFRMEYDVEKCEPGPAGGGSALAIDSGAELEMTIVVDPAELFRDGAELDAPLRFDALAASDADADDEVTLEELDEVAAPVEPEANTGTQSNESLADLLYDTLVPRVARPAGSGECEVELDRR